MYDTLLRRSFSKHEQRKLGYGALVACCLIAFSFLTVFKPYFSPLLILNLRLSTASYQNLQTLKDAEILTKNSSMSDCTSTSQIVLKDAEAVTKNPLMVNDNRTSHQEEYGKAVVKNTLTVNDTRTSHQDDAEAVTKNPLKVNDTRISHQIMEDARKDKTVASCYVRGRFSEFCEIQGDIRIDGNSATIFIVTSEMHIRASANTSWSIRPYARKWDGTAMSKVREWSVKLVADNESIPKCSQNHSVPSVLFSVGGYSGNYFHAFTDIIVPLYATAQPFNGNVKFLITDKQPWWVRKFWILLKAMSSFDALEIDTTEAIHCFRDISVGLKRQSKKELSIDPSTSAHSILDFKQFLRSSYSLERKEAIRINNGAKKRPRLMIISRKNTRAFTNIDEISEMAKKMQYEVIITEPGKNVSKSAEVMNSCDVVMGVHGAGLTNSVFLPENAVLIQVVPFGVPTWVTRSSFEEPAKGMNIKYLEYKIKVEESSLIEEYPIDHVVLKDPGVIQKQGWLALKLYLDKQNVKLDVNRFRPTLLKALELLHQ